MKKIILQTFVCISLIAGTTACSKNVKAPVKKTTATANTTVSTQNQNQTQNTNQQGHTCGGGSNSSNNAHNSGSY